MAFDCTKKRLGIPLLLLIAFAGMMVSLSCKKTVQQQEENVILDAVTTGRWYVEFYSQNTTDISTYFTPYQFQFYKNGNVDGITSTNTLTGTWASDITSYTITATFPVSAGDTLKLLNHTWKITESYLDYVEATTATSTGNNILHLRKE